MTSCDVLIIGGGPAGSTAARLLTAAGRHVVLLDKAGFPRDKTCAGWVTPHVLETLQLDLDDYRASQAASGSAPPRTLQPITAFRTSMIGEPPVLTQFDSIVSYGIRRCEFDTFLLRRCGADVREGIKVERIEQDPAGWIINGQFRAPVLIGAGGHFCPVARLLGARKQPGSSVVGAQEAEFLMDAEQQRKCSVDPQTPEIDFCRDLKGYAWCFRKGDFLNVGLGRVGGDHVSDQVADYARLLQARGSIRFEISHRFHGHAYQLYERVVPRLHADRVLLIGDSAGLAYPQSGEGIRPAVESAVIAADVLLAAGKSVSQADLQPYATRVLARFGRPRRPGLTSRLPHAWLHSVARRLLASRRFARDVVINRWFLHTRQDVLVPSAGQ